MFIRYSYSRLSKVVKPCYLSANTAMNKCQRLRNRTITKIAVKQIIIMNWYLTAARPL